MGPTHAHRPPKATHRLSREFLQRYADENDNFLDSNVTGDETWGYHFTPETKQLREWRHSSSPKPRKFKTTQSAGKVMATVFWDRKGVLWADFMANGTTINADRYCETLKKTDGRFRIEEECCPRACVFSTTTLAPTSPVKPLLFWISLDGHHPPTL